MYKYYEKKLARMLQHAKNEDFVRMVWSVDRLQSEHSRLKHKPLDNIPDKAITYNHLDAYFMHKWNLEILINELMTTPKKYISRSKNFRFLNCHDFRTILKCIEYIKVIDNHQFNIYKKKNEDIHLELARISARQFPWQRGFLNICQFYRYTFIFGQGKCAVYFNQTYGITIDRFSYVGFVIFVILNNGHCVEYNNQIYQAGISEDEFLKTIKLIAQPFDEVSRSATQQRNGIIHIADKPSVLRRTPCLMFGNNNERILSPLPELIIERITSGLFYDVINGTGEIRDEYGKRFEDYCFLLLLKMLPALRWKKEFRYKVHSKESLDSPDILCFEKNRLILAIECKASRLSHSAVFARSPEKARGYEDLTKAITQLWTFFSNCRRKKEIADLSDDVIGIVVTLDNWLQMSDTIRKKVFSDANDFVAEKRPLIIEADKKPIIFVSIEDLEHTLTDVSENAFKSLIQKSTEKKYFGWMLQHIRSDYFKYQPIENKDYPFKSEANELIPWMKKFHK